MQRSSAQWLNSRLNVCIHRNSRNDAGSMHLKAQSASGHYPKNVKISNVPTVLGRAREGSLARANWRTEASLLLQ
jgi:hypothetical protein